jgi:protein-S-isoprenylcysteine O-methyltransferase Ste14
VLLAALAGILFLSAGRLDWPQAWGFVAAYGLFLIGYTLWTARNDPGQLNERSQKGANVKRWDQVILSVYAVLLLGMLVTAGLDAGRFRWATAPPLWQGLGWLGLAVAGALIGWAAYTNTYLSRYVRIQSDREQQVVSRGPYRTIRHPMYTGVILFMLGIPLALGSLWALLPGGLIGGLFVLRTALEDRALQAELPGYREYAQKTRYRLVPGVW